MPDELAVRIFLADRTERSRRGEQRHRLVLGDHPPERARIRRADRLAFIHDRSRAMEQRAVDDIAVADHPADVGGAPPDFTRLDAVEVEHRPLQRDQMPAIVAHDALGNAGRARCVEDVERIGRQHGHAIGGFPRLDGGLAQVSPVVIAAFGQLARLLGPLQDDAGLGLDLGKPDRLVEQRLVGHDAAGLDAAACRKDQLWRGVIDTGRQFLWREAAEHHRMDGADPRAGEHGHHGLRHHRHIDDDAVALGDAKIRHHAGQRLHFVQKLGVGEFGDAAGERRIVDQRELIGAATFDMAIERVVAGVDDRAGKPAAIQALGGIENFLGRFDPVDLARRLTPKALGVAERARMDLVITAFVAECSWRLSRVLPAPSAHRPAPF